MSKYDYIPTEFGRTWVAATHEARRGIFTPLVYIDINEGNRFDADVFAQIMYWHEPNKETGKPRLTHYKDGSLWLAKNHADWFAETRIKMATVRKCLARLVERKLIFCEQHGDKGKTTPWIRVNWDEFERRVDLWMKHNIDQVGEKNYDESVAIFNPTPDTTGQPSVIAEQAPDTTGQPPCYDITAPLLPENSSNTETTSETVIDFKEEKISPQGESPMEAFIEEELFDDEPKPQVPETPKVIFTDQQILMAAIEVGFGKGGGFAGTLGKQLTGKADKGQRMEWNIEPGMNPIEITAFAIWYGTDEDHNYEGRPPTTAETLCERVMEFRGVKDMDEEKFNLYMERGYNALRNHLAESPKVKKLKEKQANNEQLIDMSDDPIFDDIAALAEGWD